MWQVQAKPGNNGNLQEEESKGIIWAIILPCPFKILHFYPKKERY